MYNRYIPDDQRYTWVGAECAPAPEQRSDLGGRRAEGDRGEGGRRGLGDLLSKGPLALLRPLRGMDSGDVLLLLILLYLLTEGDDLEPAIALGLVLLMGLGDGKKEQGRP